ncbi:MAG: hypothetical protein KAS32_08360 [Candidatus Peribacteraceae bacterium]|nr:hypothetical protein [Candidatus Peribacteraceae bacterium]
MLFPYIIDSLSYPISTPEDVYDQAVMMNEIITSLLVTIEVAKSLPDYILFSDKLYRVMYLLSGEPKHLFKF